MKKFISFLLSLSVLLSSLLAFSAEEKDALHLNFDKNIPESILVTGDISYTKGIVGDAAVFNGSSYLTLPENITENITDFTISCWVRFDKITPNVWQRVFDFGLIDGSSIFLGTWQWQKSNNVRSTIMGNQLTTSNVYKEGEWNHYAVTQKDDTITLYLNGREVAKGTNEGRLKNTFSNKNYIGFYNKNTEPTEPLCGALDEFIFAPFSMSSEKINEMAFIGLDEEKKVESLAARVYLKKNDDNSFNYFTFDDSVSSVTWSSSNPSVMTVDGIFTDKKELTDVILTANVKSVDFHKEINFEYVVGEFDGKITCQNTTIEKIQIDEIRKNSKSIDISKTYTIKSDKGYLSSEGDNLIIKEIKDETSLWRFYKSPKTNNTYAIINIKNGKCLDVTNFAVDKGSEVCLYQGGKSINQLWYVSDFNGKCGILGYQSEWFLSDTFTLSGLSDFTLWEIDETENTLLQHGEIVTSDDSKYTSFENNGYYVLRCHSGYLSAKEDNIGFEKNTSFTNTQWLFTHIEGDYYTIINRESAHNINVAGNNTAPFASVVLWHGKAGGNEQYCFEETELGYLIYGRDNKNYLSYRDGKLIMSPYPFYWTVFQVGRAKIQNTQDSLTSSHLTSYTPPVYESVSEEGFVHPGILITKDDITRIQKMVREGKEPWASSFEKLASSSFSNPSVRIYAYDSNGDTTALKVESRLKNMRMDSRSAVNQALMYVITGDEAYRANTMTILRMWSRLRDVYTTLGSDRIDHGEIGFKLTFAAELMKYTDCENPLLKWTDDDNENFIGMLNTILPKHDSWWYWMNQHGICNLATMANAIFTDNLELYKSSVKRTTTNPENGGSIDYQKGSGGSITQIFRIVDTDALNGDEISPTLVHSEMGRDQGHAYGCLGALSLCAMMSHTQNTKVDPVTGEYTTSPNGVNMFNFADERLLQAANYIGKYNLGYDVMHPTIDVGSLYCDINDTNRGAIYNTFGILYNYYKYEEKVDMNLEKYRYLKEAHEYHYPEGMENDFYIGFSDLLFTPEDAVVDTREFERIGESNHIWQMENYTALNYGSVNKNGDYITVTTPSRIAVTNGNYPTSLRNKVILKVRTNSEVNITLQNEHTVNAPFCVGVIPNTNGQWQEVSFDFQPEGVIRQRIFFLSFESENEFDIDYMSFTE